MLSCIGRAAIRRAGAGSQSTNGALWRISRVNTNQNASRSQSLAIDRAYATSTTASKTAPKKSATAKSAPTTTKAQAPTKTTKATATTKIPTATSAAKTTKNPAETPAKKPAAAPKKKIVSQAKPKRAGLTDKQKERLALKKDVQKEKAALVKVKAKELALAKKEKAALKLSATKERQKARAAIQKEKAASRLIAAKERQKATAAIRKQKAEAAKPRLELKELQVKALELPEMKISRAYNLYMSQYNVGKPASGREAVSQRFADCAHSFSQLSAQEKESLTRTVEQNKADNKITLAKWIESHTPDQIREANAARQALRRLTTHPIRWGRIEDPRLPKRSTSAFLQFSADRLRGRPRGGTPIADMMRPINEEWKSMTDAERKPWIDAFEAEKLRYLQEYKTVFHRDAPIVAANEKKAQTA